MKKINVLYQVILFVCGICLFLFFPLVQGDRSTGAELLEDRGNYWDMLTSSFKIGLVLFNYASTVLLAGCILLKKKVGAILRLIGLAMPLWMVCIWFDSDMSVSVFFSFVLLSAAVVWAAIGVWRAFAQGEKKSAEKDRFGWVAVRRARVVGWLDRMNPALVRAFVGLVGIALYFFVALMLIFSISHGNPLKMAAHVVAGLFGLALAAVVFVILRRAVKWTGARNIALPFYLYLISYALLVPSFVFPGSTSDCFGMAWVAVVLCSAVVAVFRLCLSKKSSKKTKRAGAVFAVGSLTLIGVFVAVPVAFGMLMPELTAHTDSNAWPSAR